MTAFIEAVPNGARALLIRGDPGIGKTALWRRGVNECEAAGFTLMLTRAAEEKVPLGLTGLIDLFEHLDLDAGALIADAVFEYVVAAVDMLATDGWKLLALYRFDPDTGLWHHRDSAPERAPRLDEAFDPPMRPGATAPESVLAGQLRKARWIIDAAEARPLRGPLRDPALSEAFERVRWFPLPGEGLARVLAARQ